MTKLFLLLLLFILSIHIHAQKVKQIKIRNYDSVMVVYHAEMKIFDFYNNFGVLTEITDYAIIGKHY